MQDRFGNVVSVGSKIAIASRQGSCGAELKVREVVAVIAADGHGEYAVYLTPHGRRAKLFKADSGRWVVLGGKTDPLY